MSEEKPFPWVGFDRLELMFLVSEIAGRSLFGVDQIMLASARWHAAQAKATAAFARHRAATIAWETARKGRSQRAIYKADSECRHAFRCASAYDRVATLRFEELQKLWQGERASSSSEVRPTVAKAGLPA